MSKGLGPLSQLPNKSHVFEESRFSMLKQPEIPEFHVVVIDNFVVLYVLTEDFEPRLAW